MQILLTKKVIDVFHGIYVMHTFMYIHTYIHTCNGQYAGQLYYMHGIHPYISTPEEDCIGRNVAYY